jgi:hypothetical protein
MVFASEGEHEMTATQTIRQPVQKVRVMTIDGRCIASNHYGAYGINRLNRWTWIQEAIAAECECSMDDVGCIETDEGDFFTADGLIVAYLED